MLTLQTHWSCLIVFIKSIYDFKFLFICILNFVFRQLPNKNKYIETIGENPYIGGSQKRVVV
jgi:hypothetical protein